METKSQERGEKRWQGIWSGIEKAKVYRYKLFNENNGYKIIEEEQCEWKTQKMYFPLLFQVISRSCFCFTLAAPTIVHSVLHTCSDWPVPSTYTLHCLLRTIHARSSIQFIHLSGLCSPSPLPFTTGFVIAFIFQAIEMRLATSSTVSNAANLDIGPRTVDPCSGQEATSPLATILALESPTTSQSQANQLNQNNEDDLAQVDQNYKELRT